MKKLFTFFYALIASAGTIFAESGTCGENLTWDLTDGVLTISGTGAMNDYSYNSPWYNQRKSIASLVVNNGVTSIGNNAFNECTGLNSINIPNSITSIRFCAFSGCAGLTSVTIPNSVMSIGRGAFSRCTGLTSVTIPNSVMRIESDAFSGCTSLPVENNIRYADTYLVEAVDRTQSTYTIKAGTRFIGDGAFWDCTSLTSIIIPNSVTSIGRNAFNSCINLASITIPNSIIFGEGKDWNDEGDRTFYRCEALRNIDVPASFLNYKGNFGDLDNPYTYPTQLVNITINGGELTEDAFDIIRLSYRKLETIDFSGAENSTLPDVAFNGCYNLRSLTLPANLESIGYMAVADCKNLQSINIPASVTEISQSAFENCRSLQTITFGEQSSAVPGRRNARATSNSQLQRIGNWAFYNCHELQNLEIPEGVTEIGDGAFYGCTYLEDLSLPASIQSIGDNTFALCAKMKKITVNAVVPPSIQAKTFFDVKRQIPVYVPDEVVDSYLNDALWSEFNIQGISNMPSAIENTHVGAKSTKLLRNGQLLILRGSHTYTLTGQEVK